MGEGGFGSVFQASSFRGEQAVAIKRGRRVDLTFELRDLKREVKLLQGCAGIQRSDIILVAQLRCRTCWKAHARPIQPHPLRKRRCDHPHLLRLLGHCLDKEAPCLIFPLMRGGSLQCRLQPTEEDLRHLKRLGFATSPKPLTWRQRIRVLHQARTRVVFVPKPLATRTVACVSAPVARTAPRAAACSAPQAIDALVYLHVEQGGKPSIVHCDFKPANILLDESLRACLSDTGFARAAKAQSGGAATTRMTTMQAGAFTPGFADPLTFNNGEFSVATDGHATPPSHTQAACRPRLPTPPTRTRIHAVYPQLTMCAFPWQLRCRHHTSCVPYEPLACRSRERVRGCAR